MMLLNDTIYLKIGIYYFLLAMSTMLLPLRNLDLMNYMYNVYKHIAYSTLKVNRVSKLNRFCKIELAKF